MRKRLRSIELTLFLLLGLVVLDGLLLAFFFRVSRVAEPVARAH